MASGDSEEIRAKVRELVKAAVPAAPAAAPVSIQITGNGNVVGDGNVVTSQPASAGAEPFSSRAATVAFINHNVEKMDLREKFARYLDNEFKAKSLGALNDRQLQEVFVYVARLRAVFGAV